MYVNPSCVHAFYLLSTLVLFFLVCLHVFCHVFSAYALEKLLNVFLTRVFMIFVSTSRAHENILQG